MRRGVWMGSNDGPPCAHNISVTARDSAFLGGSIHHIGNRQQRSHSMIGVEVILAAWLGAFLFAVALTIWGAMP